MSFGRLIKFVLISLGILSLLLIGNLLFLYDPGAVDIPEPIINWYEYNKYDETIIYQKEEARPITIIGARIDEYLIDGDKLLVARRPREHSGFWMSHLSKDCEYWVIDTKKHTLQKSSETFGLHCK